MGRIFFWGAAVLLLALATHLGAVLFSPAVSMTSAMERAFAVTPVNAMTVLDEEIVGNVLREANPDLVYAVCPYDLRHGALSIDAHIPEFYWSISLYTVQGDNIYTLNDEQAGVSNLRFRLELEKPTLDIEKVIGSEAEEEAAAAAEAAKSDDTVLLKTPTERGVVLLRAFLPDPAYRERVAQVLAASSCHPTHAHS
ncbi:DUF1254 domain-containing protein [Rhodoligotrophos defluvii]|uniref:DUF1254 domain-containing protein n=1 Tax=Rhodoligotrophos defluvii TaxID=2561934 RepID=UPI0010C950DD|nr:DUF1254 domain-containing protein [Rhodoligotrophos defluvii]